MLEVPFGKISLAREDTIVTTLNVNGKQVNVDVEDEMPLLWVLRDELGLTGTKYSCGIAMCGACTVHVDGQPVRSCVMPASAVVGKKITTIEALSPNGSHPVQKAWVQLQVPQCGFCQSGMMMSARALLDRTPNPSQPEIARALSGNLCRCTGYTKIFEAVERARDLELVKREGTPAKPAAGPNQAGGRP